MKLLAATLIASAALLSGCAGMNTVTSEVATYGEWPAGRAPASYAFDRLPSQQTQAPAIEAIEALEAAARGALAKAGFKPVAAGEQPDVLVQLGERQLRYDPVWADPLWYRGGFSPWRHGPWVGPGWWARTGPWPAWERVRYEREAALLIRDRTSGKPLFEARASHDSATSGNGVVLGAMFEAMLVDFPKAGINPRTVTIPLPPR